MSKHPECCISANLISHLIDIYSRNTLKEPSLYTSSAIQPKQIVHEGMLEDVNNILNSGDVPNLYGPEEMDRIMTACRPICAKKRIPATKLNVFAQVRRGSPMRKTTLSG